MINLMTTSVLDNMLVNEQGFAFVTDDDLVELLLEQRKVRILPSNVSNWSEFDKNCKTNKLENPFSLAEENLSWNFPDKYKQLDIEDYLLSKCSTAGQYQRVADELELFKERDLFDLLKFLVYFMDVVKSNNVIYGVGRGSSVASYCLHLIGVHRVDSLKYNLDIKEFLK
jgi:DNA polymerase III alpha subunit